MQLRMFQFHAPEARYADFVCYFQKQKKVVCYRVFQNNAYWAWLERRLKQFLLSVEVCPCTKPQQQSPPGDIPYLYFEAQEISRLAWNWEQASRRTQAVRRELPPKVFTQLRWEKEIDLVWLEGRSRAQRASQLQREANLSQLRAALARVRPLDRATYRRGLHMRLVLGVYWQMTAFIAAYLLLLWLLLSLD